MKQTRSQYALLFMITTLLFASASLRALPPAPQSNQNYAGDDVSNQLQENLIKAVRHALAPQKISAEINLHGYCTDAHGFNNFVYNLDLIPFHLHQPRPGSHGLQAIQDIFRSDPNIVVRMDHGVIQINIDGPPNPILFTKIPPLRLGPDEQYNPDFAVWSFSSPSAIQKAMRESNLSEGSQAVDELVAPAIPGAPHLPKLLKGKTLMGDFRIILHKFPGIIVSEDCVQPLVYRLTPGHRLIWVVFHYLNPYELIDKSAR